MFFSKAKKRIYLDYASATPVRDEVLKAMTPYFQNEFGNAGAIHKEGVAAKNVLTEARVTLARTLHIKPEGVVFTASGTESNNLAIFGTIEMHSKNGVMYSDMEIVSTHIEHPSILETLKYVALLGVVVKYAEVDAEGIVVVESLKQHITSKTILVTFAYVNSEIGVVQPVGKLSRIVHEQEKVFGTHILVHIDAAQAPLWLPCSLDSVSADLLSLDAGKCYGPKGVGVLALSHGVKIEPFMFGGEQERGLRPGTENIPLIVGAVCALRLAQDRVTERSESVMKLRDAFIKMLLTIEGVELNGSIEHRVSNNVNISIKGIDSEFAVITLDEHGIACSTKSACGGSKGDGSAVVFEITHDMERATSTVRFSLGESTTVDELKNVYEVLNAHVEKTRAVTKNLTVS